jgi:tight adherence protein B
MNKVLIGVGALALVGLFEGAYHALTYFAERRREEVRRRVQTLAEGGARGPSLLRQRRRSSIGFIDELLREVSFLQRLETLIEQAESTTTVARHLLVSLVAAAVGVVAAIVLKKPALAPLLAAIGAAAPTLLLLAARDERDRKLSEQLPNALDMMARSLRAGHALPSAFKLVATEMPAPINMEFARAYEEQNLGMTFEKAVLQMVARTPRNRDFKIFAVSVIVQKQTGGNLVEIMEKLAETIRGRYQFYGKLKALAAEGKLSGMVLGALPIITGLVFSIVNPKYTSKLVLEPMGRLFLIYAVVTWFVGIIWLRRMGKVEL